MSKDNTAANDDSELESSVMKVLTKENADVNKKEDEVVETAKADDDDIVVSEVVEDDEKVEVVEKKDDETVAVDANDEIVVNIPDDLDAETQPLIPLDISDDEELEKKDVVVEEVDEDELAEGEEVCDLTKESADEADEDEVKEVAESEVKDGEEIVELCSDDDVEPLKEEDDEEEIDVNEDVKALTSDASLSEEFKTKAATIFEAAVKMRVKEERQKLNERFEVRLEQASAEYRSSLTEKVDEYLTAAVDTWIKENRVALNSNLRTEIAEGFISSLKGVFAENYIDLPAGKEDLAESLKKKNAELTESLNKEKTAVASLKVCNARLAKSKIVAEMSESLTAMQAEKLSTLAENVSFVDDASFKKSLETLKESYFAEPNGKVNQIVESLSDINKKAAGNLVGSTAALLDRS